MTMTKPILILQLRPEDATADSEYACILKYGQLKAEDTRRIRIEKKGIPDNIKLDDYSAIIVGGSPFDISTPENKKSGIQKKIEADFNHLLEQVSARTSPSSVPAPVTACWVITSVPPSPRNTVKP